MPPLWQYLSALGTTHAQNIAEIRAAVSQVAVVHDRVGDAVEKLKPPKDAEAANKLLARGAHTLRARSGQCCLPWRRSRRPGKPWPFFSNDWEAHQRVPASSTRRLRN
jgi:hypothetical protein